MDYSKKFETLAFSQDTMYTKLSVFSPAVG